MHQYWSTSGIGKVSWSEQGNVCWLQDCKVVMRNQINIRPASKRQDTCWRHLSLPDARRPHGTSNVCTCIEWCQLLQHTMSPCDSIVIGAMQSQACAAERRVQCPAEEGVIFLWRHWHLAGNNVHREPIRMAGNSDGFWSRVPTCAS